jgi:hypothetical protein
MLQRMRVEQEQSLLAVEYRRGWDDGRRQGVSEGFRAGLAAATLAGKRAGAGGWDDPEAAAIGADPTPDETPTVRAAGRV